MSNAVTLQVQGLDELKKRLQKLANAIEGSQVEQILLDAAQPIADQARAWAPEGPTGNLKRALLAKKLQRKGRKTAPVIAAVDRKIAPHAHLVEYGSQGRQHKSGKSTGSMPAKPYFRPAVDARKGDAARIIEDGLRRLIEGVSR